MMEPIALKQSASKDEFMKALGLNLMNAADSVVFKEMWEDVTTYWNKNFEISTSRDILKPEYASNEKIQRPYKWAHIDPMVIDNAISVIWQASQPGPRMYYDMGRSEDRRVFNWVLKWLLWHVCRYRDWRNRKTRNPPGTNRIPVTTTVIAPVAGRKRRAAAAGLLDNGDELKRRKTLVPKSKIAVV